MPALVRLFPHEIVDTVATLAEVHALSETLDTAMAAQFQSVEIDRTSYVRAWASTGQSEARSTQISLTLAVAARLDRLTHRVFVRNSLRLMRAPARAAGMTELQKFLETGFDAFRAMGDATEFIATVDVRERAIASALFGVAPNQAAEHPSASWALSALP